MSKDLVQPTDVPAATECDHPVSEKTLGQIAYEAYHGPLLSWWENEPDGTRQQWEGIASAVRLAVIEECAKVARETELGYMALAKTAENSPDRVSNLDCAAVALEIQAAMRALK